LNTALPSRPIDATLTVTKAARLLGVHPNTVRAWSDAGRLRYYRINPRGDRRYRLGDLQRFLAAAESGAADPTGLAAVPGLGGRRAGHALGLVVDRRTVDATRPTADPLATARHAVDLALIDAISRLASEPDDLDEDLTRATALIRDAYDHYLVAIWELRDDRLVPFSVAWAPDVGAQRLVDRPRAFGVLGAALAAAAYPDDPTDQGRGRAVTDGGGLGAPLAILSGERPELAVVIPALGGPWGVLHIVGDVAGDLESRDGDVASVIANAVGTIVSVARRRDEVAHQLHRAEALHRVAGDIGSRLDLDRILSGLVDHAMVLFEADRGAVFLQRPDGSAVAEVSRGLSASYLASVRDFPARSLPAVAVAARQPMFATNYRDDPRGQGVHAAVVQEGYDSICTAPLLDGPELLGLLNVYHDRPHPWTEDDLETMAALATQASVAIRAAQDFERMATWAAQLGSIQQLGTRLNRLSSVHEIGMAIATELNQLIDYHNVRVYRQVGTDLIPVAIKGQVGEYFDETLDQLRVSVGEGITGWVAEHAVAQILGDAANDPRADTIPGTEEDLDESMLLAPMIFDDQVLGVLVLSKLGLNQFTADDLRLLVIYASFAAGAMATADTTERLREQSMALERQVQSQRELLQITESILTTLDSRAVLDGITERLLRLIACDNVAIEVVDPSTGLLTPLTARGIHAAGYLEPWEPGETGIATWVVEHNEPTYVADERNDPRVNHFREEETLDGSLIVVPLRGRDGAIGVLTIERLGIGNAFSDDEFELVQLFAAQVSIALQNAEVFRAVELRAQTDDLTGLLNHGTFQDRLEWSVHTGGSFSLIMLDLDDFRDVNNSLGHQAGDRLLQEIAAELVRAGRDSDQIFRYGGDEFTFLLPGTDAAGAKHVAERASHAVKAVGRDITASIGIASYPDDGSTAAGVLLAADRACFVAKRGGRDRIATAAEGLALAAEFSLQAPTPVDPPSHPID
jgi:diguanylate cyclase (GGDEF)-like protein/excisionase family DNA binding protein